MPTANLASASGQIDTSKDSVVIVSHLEGMPGGRTLDVTGYPDDEISAGHVIIRETSTGNLKPMPITGNPLATGTLPAGHTYHGILAASIKTANAQAAIMVRGTVNEAYCKYTVIAGAKTALSLIRFISE